jgi:integrase
MTKQRPGTWLARFYDGERDIYPEGGIGDFSTLPASEQFDAAKRAAEAWFQQLDAGVSPTSTTVAQSCAAYAEWKRSPKNSPKSKDPEATAKAITARFKLLVYSDPIAKLKLSELKEKHLAAWVTRVLALGNSHASYNRDATMLRKALNLARSRREVASDIEWREALKPFPVKGRGRKLYLTIEERRRLLENASDESRPFLETLCLLPLRAGDPAKLRVEDLDVHHRMLRVPEGKGAEAREIPLPDEAFAHFKKCAKDKLPGAWLVSRANGGPWEKGAWADEVKIAAAGAKLPRSVVATHLRHAVLTDLVKGGLDLMHVAKLAGTSIKMIQENYGHLQNEHARAALKKLTLMP